MDKPNTIQDCEIVPDRLIIYDDQCIGSKKYERFAMISLVHSHGDNTSPQFQGKGFADIMVTREQAEILVEKLQRLLIK